MKIVKRLAVVGVAAALVLGTFALGVNVPAQAAASVPFDPIISSAPIDGYLHDPQTTSGYATNVCFRRLRDGTQAAYNFIDSVFGWPTTGTMYACREMWTGSCNGRSVNPDTDPYFFSNCWSNHAQGRAIDVMVGGSAPDPVPLARGNDLVNWLLRADSAGNRHARARRLGVQQIIWNDRCWASNNTGDRNILTASAMRVCNISGHLNHVHLDLAIEGANGLTTAYIGGAHAVPDGVAIWRTSTNTFHIDDDSDGDTDAWIPFGNSGDVPVMGDWNGDGQKGVGIFRPSTGWFHLDNDRNAVTDTWIEFGSSSDVPVIGDWDGDGRDGVGIFRPSTGWFHLDNNRDGTTDVWIEFGSSSDVPVTGDWDGDGRDGVGIHRPSTGWYHLDNDLNEATDRWLLYGGPGDIIVQ